ncbi:RS5 [Hepatospora eriocheir]|uniref:RS5 n=1 Tax=Hepatospora eriocheir TaxID=1081669 RepID=A0A1X0QHB2_9MICR|nr:RS5 [Hepatospora eriocheir]
MSELQLFNKYSFKEVIVSDEALKEHINVTKEEIFPHSSTKANLGRFGNNNKSIVERFIVRLMRKGRNNGKKRLAMRLYEESCEIVAAKTKKNPIQILVDAIINSGPREMAMRVGRGSNLRRSSVDVSSYARVSKALQYLTDGIRNSAFKNEKNTMPEVIAYELINAASNNEANSYGIKKKSEIERIAKSNR